MERAVQSRGSSAVTECRCWMPSVTCQPQALAEALAFLPDTATASGTLRRFRPIVASCHQVQAANWTNVLTWRGDVSSLPALPAARSSRLSPRAAAQRR